MITAKVGGREVSLYMGMKAVTAITKKYGSIKGLCEVLSDNENAEAQNEATFFVANQLNINASIIEEREPVYRSNEVLEAYCRPHEHIPLFKAVCEAIKESTDTTIETELIGGEKN